MKEEEIKFVYEKFLQHHSPHCLNGFPELLINRINEFIKYMWNTYGVIVCFQEDKERECHWFKNLWVFQINEELYVNYLDMPTDVPSLIQRCQEEGNNFPEALYDELQILFDNQEFHLRQLVKFRSQNVLRKHPLFKNLVPKEGP